MKTLPFYQVDAFTNQIFKGNPAGVCPLTEWLSDDVMQKIAAENNLSETAFYVEENGVYNIRWFTPTIEIPLCGHATLASAFVEFNIKNNISNEIVFKNQSNQKLVVIKKGNIIELDFPAGKSTPMEVNNIHKEAFGTNPNNALDYGNTQLFVFENEEIIKNIKPNLNIISTFKCNGVIVTAKGNNTDVVCRMFAPQSGIDEDPVTGSAHTNLIPYWSKKLGKTNITSMQLSERTGFLDCTFINDRVKMAGEAKLYLKGEIYLD